MGIVVHLLVAVYMYGERDLPSYTHMGGETGKWGPNGDDGTGVQVTDHQFDVRNESRGSTDSSRSWGSSCAGRAS